MVAHTHASYLSGGLSEVILSKDCSTEESVSTISPPSVGKGRRRSFKRPLGRVETFFLFITSIVLTYIYKCSTRPYIAVVYHRDEAWVPDMSGMKAKRRASHHHHSRRHHHSHRHDKKNATTMDSYSSQKGLVMLSAYPQVVFYGGASFKAKRHRRIRSRHDLGSLRKRRQKGRPSWSLPTNTTYCVPMKPWQSTSFPTCNNVHELSLSNENEEQARLLGNGGWRTTWKVRNMEETVAYKTLRWDGQSFEATTEKRHRIDAISTERLTASSHVIDIYGYCGQSVINEFAKDGTLLSYIRKRKSPRERLEMARDVALGIADLHDFEGEGNATIVHKDIKPANIVIVDGVLKLNDFNDAEFLQWHTITNRRCGFRRKRWTPTYHSPEEVWETLLSEKVDIYALGAVIFFIMTGGHHPYKSERISQYEKFKRVAKGVRAKIPSKIKHSKDPAITVLRDLFLECQTYWASKRPSARQVANRLNEVLASLPSKNVTSQ